MNEKRAYELLGLRPGASPGEIRQAYRDLSLVWHPDRFPDHPRLRLKAEAQLREVIEAHDLLVRISEKGNSLRPRDPEPHRAEAPVVKPAKVGGRTDAASVKNPLFDPANLLFCAYLILSLRTIGAGGGFSLIAKAMVVPVFFALAYNVLQPAQRRLRMWYVASTVIFALITVVFPARHTAEVSRDWEEHRPGGWSAESGSYGGSTHVFPASQPLSPGDEPSGSGAPRGPYDPAPPAAPVPPVPPAVPAARAQ